MVSTQEPVPARSLEQPPTAVSHPLPAWVPPLMIFAAAAIVFGVLWDISWHETVGRDTFWTAAHLLIHFGGTLGGLMGGWLAIDATFLRPGAWRGRSVNLGFGQAPLGAMVAIWGAVAMITSAPFDNWWHNAYGLDVKILSPPHMLLALGMYGVVTGALLLTLSRRNQVNYGTQSVQGAWLVILAKGVQVSLAAIMLTELSMPVNQHSTLFYYVSAALYPAALVSSASEKGVRWPATKVALTFMLLNLSIHWVLPLFPAEPRLAPIFNRVNHMIALPFPLLLVFPAFGIDLVVRLFQGRVGWRWNLLLAVCAGVVFVGVFTPIQWNFSRFMISKASDNWFFGGFTRYFSYTDHHNGTVSFWGVTDSISRAVFGSLLIASISAFLGRRAGWFAARVQR